MIAGDPASRRPLFKEVSHPGNGLLPGVYLTGKTAVVGPKTRCSDHDIRLEELDVAALYALRGARWTAVDSGGLDVIRELSVVGRLTAEDESPPLLVERRG